jgi:hypothetical protein
VNSIIIPKNKKAFRLQFITSKWYLVVFVSCLPYYVPRPITSRSFYETLANTIFHLKLIYMKVPDAIRWFKETYAAQLNTVTAGTPFDADLLCAIAYQETGFIWSNLIKKVPLKDIPFLCVGDTIDSPRRKPFPKNKQDLLTAPGGEVMFDIARNCLLQMAEFINGYDSAVANPNKFCHGYGIFQYDLQHFEKDPDYFLQKKWIDPANTFLHCVKELFEAKSRQGWKSKTTLTDREKVFVAIAYNTGTANLRLEFKQGFKSDDGRFYGENIFDFMNIAKSITPGNLVAPANPAPIPPPTPISSTSKKIYRVKVTSNTLNLRSEPKVVDEPVSNRIASLPNGHLVGHISGSPGNKFFEVETSLNGANLHGFAASEFLELVTTKSKRIPVAIPFTTPPQSGITEVFMPQSSSMITKRTGAANAFSLSEPDQPMRRKENDPAILREDIMKIIGWLNVDKETHKRYQPGDGKTFCNIYAHDLCFLAGVYLPRVWWSQRAIEKLARNEIVQPLLGNTINEIRANSIFDWLKDFGERFGWRQTGELTKLQDAANLGGMGLIIAKRIDEGRSGHVTMIVPEMDGAKAKRNESGDVVRPLQSQAGATNFKMSTGTKEWWLGSQFRDHAFWIHS